MKLKSINKILNYKKCDFKNKIKKELDVVDFI